MAEIKRKLDAEHKGKNRLVGIILLFGALVFFIRVFNDPKDAYGYTTGATIGFMVYAFICLILGIITFSIGTGGDCHCTKCCGNASEDGLYCNGHQSSESNDAGYERHYQYDNKGKQKGYIEVPKK